MAFFNSEQSRVNTCKETLKAKSDAELEDIAKQKTTTSLFLGSGKSKVMQTAAFQLLRERKILSSFVSSKMKCEFKHETDYLLSSSANRLHLEAGIKIIERGSCKTQEVLQDLPIM